MKTSAIVCAVLAGSLGFSGMASAAIVGTPGWNAEHGGAPAAQPQVRQHQQRQQYQQRGAQQNWQQRGNRQAWQQRSNAYQQPRYMANGQYYQNVVPAPGQPHPHFYNSRDFTYSQPYGHQHRFYRGGYLPREYLGGSYYVNNWNAYPGLYAPPYGYQWVNVGGEFLLVALATGLIANALVAGY